VKLSTAAVVVCVGSLCACNLKRETVTVEPYTPPVKPVEASPLLPVAPAPVAAAPVARRSTFTVSSAIFKGDNLLQCVDGSLDIPVVEGSSYDEEKMKTILASGLLPAKANPTRLQRRCDVQFKDRPPFASCSISVPLGDAGAGSMSKESHWYSFGAVFQNDGLMKECITHGGTWEAIARDSDLFRMAKLEFDQARLMKQVRRYAPDLDE
jgi:hypothetical protein